MAKKPNTLVSVFKASNDHHFSYFQKVAGVPEVTEVKDTASGKITIPHKAAVAEINYAFFDGIQLLPNNTITTTTTASTCTNWWCNSSPTTTTTTTAYELGDVNKLFKLLSDAGNFAYKFDIKNSAGDKIEAGFIFSSKTPKTEEDYCAVTYDLKADGNTKINNSLKLNCDDVTNYPALKLDSGTPAPDTKNQYNKITVDEHEYYNTIAFDKNTKTELTYAIHNPDQEVPSIYHTLDNDNILTINPFV